MLSWVLIFKLHYGKPSRHRPGARRLSAVPGIAYYLHSTSFFSISYALFCSIDAPQLPWFLMLAHSFYRYGGVYPYLPQSRNTK